MARAQPSAVLSVEVFIERDQIPPERVVLKQLRPAEHRPSAIFAQENVRQPPGYFARRLPQRFLLPGTSWYFHFELIAVVIVNPLERFDQQEVQRKPNRPAPVRIPA